MKKLLKRFVWSFHCGEKGFTLIELLIVIVILGILSSVAIPQVTKFIRSGQVAAANSELALVRTAMGAAMVDSGVTSLPGSGGSLLTVTFKAANDFKVTGTYDVGDYIQGGYAQLQGTYTFSADGHVTTGVWTTSSGVTWNDTTKKFE
jgi:prepilin-type N-terminal cleavage/methylation domain-containing protein